MKRKEAVYKGLQFATVWFEDTSSTSPDYFQISEFPTRLTSGKNLFKLRGNPTSLRPGSFLNIEVLDYNGNPIYSEVIDFIDGTFNLTDSHGRVWNYPKVSSGMRQKTEKILNFIQDRYQIDYVKFIAQFSKEYEIFDGDEELIRNIILFLESTPSLITKLN
jgi:hypothetical protein